MARIALGITLLFLLITCFFGFETRSKVQDLTAKNQQLGTDLASAQQEAARDKALARGAQDDLTKAKDAASTAQSQLATAQSDLQNAKDQATVLSGSIDALQTALANATHTPINNVQPTGPSTADFDKLTAQLSDSKAQIAELQQVKETLTNKEKDAETRADDLQKVVDNQKAHVMRNGLEGEVLAYNPGYNFVVLSIGDRQGAVNNAEMILERGGSQIGKVRITEVEPSTSVADIIPGSLARGVRVQPGDHVIFPGS